MEKRCLQQEILRLKREKGITVLAHTYVAREVSEIADFTGDSYALAKWAQGAQGDVILCGVHFMAETVKILSPQKKVYLANPKAGCPMAEQLTVEALKALKAQHPNAAVAAYINTTAALKTECDVCVTSSSAEKIIAALPEKEILFIPDINLGSYLAARLTDKVFHLFDGGCPCHKRTTVEDVLRAKEAHPEALFLVHPECPPAVVSLADYAGSTAGIMQFAKESSRTQFIIGTENTVVCHLAAECEGKQFFPLKEDLVCPDMRRTTLQDVLACLKGEREELVLDETVRLRARRCIDRMIALGG